MHSLVLIAAGVCLTACYESSGTTSDVPAEGELDGADQLDADMDLIPDRPDGPDMPDYPDIPDVPDFPDLPDLPDVPEMTDAPEDVPPVTAEEYCTRFVTAACMYFENCCTDAELDELWDVGFGCEGPPSGDLYLECLHDPGEAIRAGRIIVDPSGLALFEDALLDPAGACPNFGVYPFMKSYYYRLVRAPALMGRLDEGEGCSFEEECLEGLYCDSYYDSCRETLRIGAVCRDDRECEVGLVCARGRCAHPGEEGDRCGKYDDCDMGLWCEDEHCVPVLGVGMDCYPEVNSCEGICSFYGPGDCKDFCNGR